MASAAGPPLLRRGNPQRTRGRGGTRKARSAGAVLRASVCQVGPSPADWRAFSMDPATRLPRNRRSGEHTAPLEEIQRAGNPTKLVRTTGTAARPRRFRARPHDPGAQAQVRLLRSARNGGRPHHPLRSVLVVMAAVECAEAKTAVVITKSIAETIAEAAAGAGVAQVTAVAQGIIRCQDPLSAMHQPSERLSPTPILLLEEAARPKEDLAAAKGKTKSNQSLPSRKCRLRSSDRRALLTLS